MKLQIQKGDTLDSSKVVFPIGKLKGRNLYELMENEPEKLKWFVNQQFFKEKYSNIYNIIINGSNDIKDSKEHNEIVQMFYDWNFLFKFYLYKKGFASRYDLDEANINYYLKDLKNKLNSVYNEYKVLYKHYIYTLDFCNELDLLYNKNKYFIEKNKDYYKTGMYADLIDTEDLLKEIKANLDTYRNQFYELKDKLKIVPDLKLLYHNFERSIHSEYLMNDIVIESYSFYSYINYYKTELDWKHNFNRIEMAQYKAELVKDRNMKIEIKPIVGEDYPDVLRQCKRQNTDILLIKDFVCESTTIDTVKEMFYPIDIVILNDVLKIEVNEDDDE
jgi:uncharacterized protein (DUF3820 family)